MPVSSGGGLWRRNFIAGRSKSVQRKGAKNAKEQLQKTFASFAPLRSFLLL
jgi:hypothetical protein